MRLTLQILLPLLVLAVCAAVAGVLISLRGKPQVVTPEPFVPVVDVVAAAPEPLRIDVTAQGTVEPRIEVELSPQVGGRVIAVHPELRAGGFVPADTTLVQIEAIDYELAVAQALGAEARAELLLAQESAEAEAALRAWQQLEGDKPADPLVTRAPQLAEARAALAAAKAASEQARLNLQRTALKLPFAGRVRDAGVEVAQQVMPGVALAHIHAVDAVEVHLPVPDRDAQFLALPLHGRDAAAAPVAVTLTALFAGREHRWQGVVDRVGGEIDRRTRMLTLIARVDGPYAQNADGRPPLAVGMFVEARLHGVQFDAIVTLPVAALRAGDRVLVVHEQDGHPVLTEREITVLRRERDVVRVQGGLSPGERVCITPIDVFSPGMQVKVGTPATGAGR